MRLSPLLDDAVGELHREPFHVRWWHVAAGVVGVLVVGLILFVTIQPIKVLPRMTLAPGVSLVDSQGQALTSGDLLGSVVLYNFTYTGCAAPCVETGAMTAALQEALRGFDRQGIPVQLLTVSFDPVRDTRVELQRWADEHGADSALWRVATGEADALKMMIGRGFSTWYAQDAEGSFQFDPTFVLVDGEGFLRARYDAATMTPEVFLRDVALIVNEARNSSGASKLVYEAAHLFLCYP